MEWLRSHDPAYGALRRATRAALVMPAMFALADKAIGNPVMGTFAAFGSFAMLLLVDFAGPVGVRLLNQSALGLACAFLFSLYILAVNAAVERDSAWRITAAQFAIVALMCFVTCAFLPGGRANLHPARMGHILTAPAVWVNLALLTVFTTLIAFGLLTFYQPRIDPTHAAVIYLAEPSCATAYAAVTPIACHSATVPTAHFCGKDHVQEPAEIGLSAPGWCYGLNCCTCGGAAGEPAGEARTVKKSLVHPARYWPDGRYWPGISAVSVPPGILAASS